MTDPKLIADPALVERYQRLSHAMQSGVRAEHEAGSQDGTPKHLRVGVNLALCEGAALVRPLIRKGVIADFSEYLAILNEVLDEEVISYEARLSERAGVKVTLA